jgi:protoheme IX farnesyltransferase
MRRTVNRALPSGRLTPSEALYFGGLLAATGTTVLLIGANTLAALVALVTLGLYVFVYTPLKTRTTLNTVFGAIPGALPPVIGWSAATGRMGVEAVALFLIVFLWQFPHFLAIAWIYRDDYGRAGFRMLSVGDHGGKMSGGHALSYSLALLPVGLLPAMIGLAGPVYFGGAMLLGLLYILAAARFLLEASDRRARVLLRTSFVYLPTILLLLLLNPVPY